jgi:hypothetical protein
MHSNLNQEDLLPYPLILVKKTKNGKVTSEEYDIPESEKQSVLKSMYPFDDLPDLTSELFDLHAERLFMVKDFKVVREDETNYLVSPYYYESGGTVIDWMPASWAKTRA